MQKTPLLVAFCVHQSFCRLRDVLTQAKYLQSSRSCLSPRLASNTRLELHHEVKTLNLRATTIRATTLLFAVGLFGTTAWADSITLAGTFVVSGNGFGSNPRALTIQSHGPSANSESGCIGPGLVAGASACAAGDGAVGGNETNPISSPKQAAPSLSSLGISNANQIGILFDGVQPQNADNNKVTGTFSDLATNPGNGQSDYLFILDPAAVTAFNAAFAGNLSDTIALDSTISFANQSGGPESYSFINVAAGSSTTPTPALGSAPEPGSLLLFGTGLAGTAGLLRKRFLRT
jgi:hypothetical protein